MKIKKTIISIVSAFVLLFMANEIDSRLRPEMHRPGHRHCIKIMGLGFNLYAADHNGDLPVHTNGYGDALLLLLPYLGGQFDLLTGPGFDSAVFERAKINGSDVPESGCGRVYIQGLKEEPITFGLIILFDKRPSYGGDHFPARPWFPRPLLREVLYMDGHTSFVEEINWHKIVTEQIEMLVAAGVDRKEAEWYYSHGEVNERETSSKKSEQDGDPS